MQFWLWLEQIPIGISRSLLVRSPSMWSTYFGPCALSLSAAKLPGINSGAFHAPPYFVLT